ncbi:MAG: GGDEF domain-containing protein [bacterium]|nr:GGDEF domain-containing protein [bacterium]
MDPLLEFLSLPDHFYADHFGTDDFQSFSHFVSYVGCAVMNPLFQARARRHRNFDEETGLPNASYISKRIHGEISRSQGREHALALAVCRIENLEAICRE